MKYSSVLIFLILVLAFFVGYFLTDTVFRVKLIPYPFEWFGVAAGLGCALWALAVITWFKKRKGKLR